MHNVVTLHLEFNDGRPVQRIRTSTYTVIAEAGNLLRVLDDHRNVYQGIVNIRTVFELPSKEPTDSQ